MKSFKLFRTIWRINAFLILGIGVIGIFVLLWGAMTIFKETTGTRQRAGIVNIEEGKEVATKWSLGHFTKVGGTPYLMAPARSEQKYRQAYFSKETDSIRNYLFFHSVDQSGHWLLPHHNYLITTTEWIGSRDDKFNYKDVRGFLFVVIKEDTNHDSRLTSEDKQCIAISDATGRSYKEIIDKVDSYLGIQMDPNQVLIFITKENKNYVAVVNIEKNVVISTKELPALP